MCIKITIDMQQQASAEISSPSKNTEVKINLLRYQKNKKKCCAEKKGGGDQHGKDNTNEKNKKARKL